MKKHTLEAIEELLCAELDTFGEKDHIGGMSELQMLDTLLHSAKNLYKVMDESEGEASYRGGENSYYSRGRGGSYRMYSRDDGSYDDGSYRRGRDRMGRFVSRSGGDMVDRLKDMMHETEDPHEKKELREFISSIEHRG